MLIDGHAILHRAYHAYPPLTTSKGELVGAVYGFTSILLTVLARIKPQYIAVTFDKKAPTFRHKQFAAYKAHRKPMDQELVNQQERVHQVVKALNIPIFEIEGYEADDLIGTIAKKAGKDKQATVIVATGDADAFQLASDRIKIFMPARGKQPEKIYDEKAVREKYGFAPAQIIDFKALSGDMSDGIPGVSGIGPKTATDLIVKYGSFKKIYDNLSQLPTSLADKLDKGRQQAELSYQLATIDTRVPLTFDWSCCKVSDYNKEKVVKLFEKLEFKSLVKKLPNDNFEEAVEEIFTSKKKDDGQIGLF